jgi:hypothetical protein
MSVEAGGLNVRRKVVCEVMGSWTVEIITGRERRRRWSVADKLRILAECDAPGVQVAEVARAKSPRRQIPSSGPTVVFQRSTIAASISATEANGRR